MILESKAGCITVGCALRTLQVLGWAAAAEKRLSCRAVHNTLPFAAGRQGVNKCEPVRCRLREDR